MKGGTSRCNPCKALRQQSDIFGGWAPEAPFVKWMLCRAPRQWWISWLSGTGSERFRPLLARLVRMALAWARCVDLVAAASCKSPKAAAPAS